MRHPSLSRVLALDLHPRHFGYVVVESPQRLLDWGGRSYRCKGNSADVLIRKRLRPLLELWRPSLLLIHHPRQTGPKRNDFQINFCKRIVTEAKNHRVSVRTLTKTPKQGPSGKPTKYENARRAAGHFSVLRWKLPPKRKPWESEDYRMSMFTAAAAAFTTSGAICRPSPAKSV